MKSAAAKGTLRTAPEGMIVTLAQAGDTNAFEELVKRRQATIRGLLRHMCRDATLAADLSQQVFLQAWTQLGQLRLSQAFGPWLRQIAVNVCLQQMRRKHPAFDAPFPELQSVDSNDEAGTRTDLTRALAQLSPSERLCVVLAYEHGMSHGEIATATKLPLGTVKSHIARGSAQLRTLLATYR